MSSVHCLYCGWASPVGTSYCNDCGMSLALRPCRHCQSPNERDAAICTTCGAAFLPVDAWSDARAGLAAVLGAVPQPRATPGEAALVSGTMQAAGVPYTASAPHLTGAAQSRGTPHAAALMRGARARQAASASRDPALDPRAQRAGQPSVVLCAPAPEIERDPAFRFALAAVLVGCAGIVWYGLDRAPHGPEERRASAGPATASARQAGSAKVSEPLDESQAEAESLQAAAAAAARAAYATESRPTPIAPARSSLATPVLPAAARGCTDAVVALGLCEARPEPPR